MLSATWLLWGVSLRDGSLYVAYELAYVLLPGCLLYAVLSPKLGDRLRLLAIGWPLGYALELGAYALTAALHARGAFVFLAPAAVLTLGPLAIRRHGASLWPRPATEQEARIGLAPLAIVAVAISAALVLLALAFFAANPLPGHVRSVSYYVDNVWDTSLAAEARHHWPITEPYVAGHALLHYYYGFFLHVAAVNQVTGVALSSTILRFAPSTVILLAALQLWSLGRSLGRSPWVGPLAVVLFLVVEDLNLDPARPGMFGAGMFEALPLSPTFAFGAVLFLGLLALIQSRLGEESTGALDAAEGALGWLAMVGILVVALTIVKAPAAADFTGGLALFWLWRTFTAGPSRLLSCCLALSVAGSGAIYMLVLRGGTSRSVHLGLFAFVKFTGFAPILKLPSALAIAPLLATVALTCLVTFVPLLGACWLLWRRSAITSFVVFCTLIFAVSLLAYLVADIPGDGQSYLLIFGYIAMIPVAARGLVALWDDTSPATHRRLVGTCCAVLALGVLAAGSTFALPARKGLSLAAWYLAAYGLVGAASALAVLRLERGLAPLVASRIVRMLVCCIPILGILGLVRPIAVAAPDAWKLISHTRMWVEDSRENQGMTAALYRGLIWVRENTGSCDVLAVNNHLTRAGGDESYSLYYYYSAFTERRVYLESWQVTPSGISGGQPFPGRLALNDRATLRGDPRALRELARAGVGYVLIDKMHGGGAPEAPSVSRLVFANSALDVYRLLPSGVSSGSNGRCAADV